MCGDAFRGDVFRGVMGVYEEGCSSEIPITSYQAFAPSTIKATRIVSGEPARLPSIPCLFCPCVWCLQCELIALPCKAVC